MNISEKGKSITSIWIEAEEWPQGQWNSADSNSRVIVTLGDGSRWTAMFFSYRNIETLFQKNSRTGECLSGKYFWSEDMVLVDEVSRARIEEVVKHIFDGDHEDYKAIFSKITE